MEDTDIAQGNLGVLFNNLSGKAGSVVFAKTKDGTVVKPRITPSNPSTPAQVAARAALTKASGAFRNMTPAQVGAWQTYAQTQTQRDEINGKTTKPTSISAFMKLGCKFLQVAPTGTVPLVPPTAAFGGDSITVTAAGALGKVVFTGSAKNTAGIVTEVLVQQVANLHRKPQKGAYRTKGFTDFSGAGGVYNLTLTPGFYAVAYRFVNSVTGQMVALVPLGIMTVG